MKTITKLILFIVVIVMLFTMTTTTFAQTLFALPGGFSIAHGFTGQGANRVAYCKIWVTDVNRLARTNGELQDNAGTMIDRKTSVKSPRYAEVLLDNKTNDLGRIVLFCTFNGWVGAEPYTEYTMDESLN